MAGIRRVLNWFGLWDSSSGNWKTSATRSVRNAELNPVQNSNCICWIAVGVALSVRARSSRWSQTGTVTAALAPRDFLRGGRLEEQGQRFNEVVPRLGDGIALAGDIHLRAQSYMRVSLAFHDRGRLSFSSCRSYAPGALDAMVEIVRAFDELVGAERDLSMRSRWFGEVAV